MGFDATALGVQIFFEVLLPGYVFFVCFRWTAGFKGKVGEFSSICSAAIFGLLLLVLIGWGARDNTEGLKQHLSNPFAAGLALSGVALIIGLVYGWAVRSWRPKAVKNGTHEKSETTTIVRGGDITIRAGDGGLGGKGGDVHIGPGTYKAGDAVIHQES